MKKNICVLGNSHVGALKRAWDLMPEWHQEYNLVFFTARSNGLGGLILIDNKLVPKTDRLKRTITYTSGGKSEIDIVEYDLFLIYGLQMEVFFVEPGKFFSSAVIKQTVLDSVKGTTSWKIMEMIRSVTNKKIYVGHNPLPIQKKGDDRIYPPESYLSGINLMNDEVYDKCNAELIAQPADTIVNGCFTERELSKGSKRLPVGDAMDEEAHPDHDSRHMNEEFGKKWLSCFLSRD